MRKRLLADPTTGTTRSSGRQRLQATALALAAAALLGTASSPALALGLGRVTVQSALGEPLRAEIDLTEATPEELASLRTVIAAPEAFRSRGVEYNPALGSATVTLEQRSDGRPVLLLRSPRPVNDPFVDLILESSWSSGRITRDYTLLFDPPGMRQPAQPLTPQVAQPSAPAAEPAPRATAAAPAPAPAPAAALPAQRRAEPPPPAVRGPAARAQAREVGRGVTVQAGDTAARIAGANKPDGVSLDQMLVAMLRANPDAFVDGNVNRLRAGAVLEMPAAEQAAQVEAAEARRTLVAQSRDFNEFRRRLAESAPGAAKPAEGQRQSSGQITAQVEDKRPAAAAPDKLTLSKGAAKPGSAEEAIARDRAGKDSASRVAELSRNVADLNRLGSPQASGPAGGASAAKGINLPVGAASVAKPASAPAPAPAAAAVKPASAPAAKPAPAAPVAAAPAVPAASRASQATASASAAAAMPGSAAVAAKPPAPAARQPAPPPEPSFADELMDNPLLPAAAGGLLALLLGLGFYRWRQRKKPGAMDSSFLESRLQPDSFFGGSGGQRVDTAETGMATGSSMVYSPSQLDAAGDVDPVAEADVYLAYGRDLQAEEILKEALRSNPQRVAIHAKLLEIYARRRDAQSFGTLATQALNLTQGSGPEWEHICELGQELDPDNALYRGGAAEPAPSGAPSPQAPARAPAAQAAAAHNLSSMATQVLPASELPSATAAPAAPDIDLDLDFSLDEPAAAGQAPASERTQVLDRRAAEAEAEAASLPPLDMDFDNTAPATTRPQDIATAPAPAAAADPNALSFDLELPPTAEPPPAATQPPAAAGQGDGMIEFDLGALSLDVPGSNAPTAAADPDEPPSTAGLSLGGFDEATGDPLATKLALAQEFNAIGDPDGARSLAQEVIAEASGDLKARAQKFLAEIG